MQITSQKADTGTRTTLNVHLDVEESKKPSKPPATTSNPSSDIQATSITRVVALDTNRITRQPATCTLSQHERPLPPVPAKMANDPSAYPHSLRTTISSRRTTAPSSKPCQAPLYQPSTKPAVGHNRTKSSAPLANKTNTGFIPFSSSVQSLNLPFSSVRRANQLSTSKSTGALKLKAKSAQPPRPSPPEPWLRPNTPSLEHYIERGLVEEFPPGSGKYRLLPSEPTPPLSIPTARNLATPAPALLTRTPHHVHSQHALIASVQRQVKHPPIIRHSTESNRTMSTLSDRSSLPKRDSPPVIVNVDGKYAWPKWV